MLRAVQCCIGVDVSAIEETEKIRRMTDVFVIIIIKRGTGWKSANLRRKYKDDIGTEESLFVVIKKDTLLMTERNDPVSM